MVFNKIVLALMLFIPSLGFSVGIKTDVNTTFSSEKSSSGSNEKNINFGEGSGYIKLDREGNQLPGTASSWVCLLDERTNLIWEIKTDNNSLMSKDNTYTWYNPDSLTNGGDEGTKDYGHCEGSACDTYSYVQKINSKSLCGAKDWRMPSKDELLSIIDNGRSDPEVVFDYFPNMPSDWYWTSSIDKKSPHYAWIVNFFGGSTYASNKYSHHRVRLVRDKK